jgi:tetratricopeptide (TPR) repeat protein
MKRNKTTTRWDKSLLSTLRAVIGQGVDPSSASPQSCFAQAEEMCKKGDVRFKQRDWAAATDCYREALALDAGHPEARALFVDSLYRRDHAYSHMPGYLDETVTACEEALRLNPNCSTASHFLMRSLQDLGRQKEAYRLHEKTTLGCLTLLLPLLTQPQKSDKRSEAQDLSNKLIYTDAIVLHACRLLSAYGQESLSEPIDWDGYLDNAIDTD